MTLFGASAVLLSLLLPVTCAHAQIAFKGALSPEYMALIDASKSLETAYKKGDTLAPKDATIALDMGCNALRAVSKSRSLQEDLQRLEKMRSSEQVEALLLVHDSFEFIKRFGQPENEILFSGGVPEMTRLNFIVYARKLSADDVAKHGKWRADEVLSRISEAAGRLCDVSETAKRRLREAETRAAEAQASAERERSRQQLVCGIKVVGAGAATILDAASVTAAGAGTAATAGAASPLAIGIASASVSVALGATIDAASCFAGIK
jgi:hypothetical protein